VRIKTIELQNFRCFKQASFDLNNDITIIYGENGAGKTSLVEAIHYLCYVRSFKTRSLHELVHADIDDQFLLKGDIVQNQHEILQDHTVQIAYAHNKKKVKIDQKALSSYKELFSYCQVITATQDDIEIIRGGPGYRRDFIDEAILLAKPSYLSLLKRYQNVLEQRNALLGQPYHKDMYVLWTEKLYDMCIQIQQTRQSFILELQPSINKLLQTIFDADTRAVFTYSLKWGAGLEGKDFIENCISQLRAKEYILQRSLFGAHLDEISIQFQGKSAKVFASRGQQRLLALLLKIALIENLLKKQIAPVFVLDDVISDFDEVKLERIIRLLEGLFIQLIFTIPQHPAILIKHIQSTSVQVIEL